MSNSIEIKQRFTNMQAAFNSANAFEFCRLATQQGDGVLDDFDSAESLSDALTALTSSELKRAFLKGAQRVVDMRNNKDNPLVPVLRPVIKEKLASLPIPRGAL